MSLDDVIESSSWGSGNGSKGSWGRGEGSSWGRGNGDTSGSWSRSGKVGSANAEADEDTRPADRGRGESAGNGASRSTSGRPETKLDMSLDEVIEQSGGSWWGGKSGGGWGKGSKGKGSSSSWWRMDQASSWDRAGGMRSAGGERYGTRRGRGEDESSYRHVKRIKVANVPRDLAARDIKHAFEAEAGKTTSCELDRGIAYLTFQHPEDARKAVETFDRGELNGKTITVTLEP